MTATKKTRRNIAVGLNRFEVIASASVADGSLVGREATVIRPGGVHTYTVVEIRPYINAKGYASAIVAWTSRCAICGDQFRCETGANPMSAPSTCEVHRLNVYGQNRKQRIGAQLRRVQYRKSA